MAALDLDLLNWRAVAFDHLCGLVHRVGGVKMRSSSLVMSKTGASIFLSPSARLLPPATKIWLALTRYSSPLNSSWWSI